MVGEEEEVEAGDADDADDEKRSVWLRGEVGMSLSVAPADDESPASRCSIQSFPMALIEDVPVIAEVGGGDGNGLIEACTTSPPAFFSSTPPRLIVCP